MDGQRTALSLQYVGVVTIVWLCDLMLLVGKMEGIQPVKMCCQNSMGIRKSRSFK